MGSLGAADNEHFSAKSIGEFCPRMGEIILTSKRINKNATKHNKTHSGGRDPKERSKNAKETIKKYAVKKS